MSEISYKEEKQVSRNDLLRLYGNANWTAYTENPEKLEKAVTQSLRTITARNGEKLVGIIRAVGDGETILYIQDIIVDTDHKRKGIGKKLMELLCSAFPDVRQKVLLTDDNPETRGFYEALGFESCDAGKLVSFVKLSNS